MDKATAIFLLQAAAISLSGVMAPGPITAATLASGARQRHAGALIAIGHGIVEFPLMGLLAAGLGAVLRSQGFRIGVGLAGGAALIALAVIMLAGLGKTASAQEPRRATSPLWTGVILSGSNPYFLLWWATAGLALMTTASGFGALALGLFAVTHWLCDLVWLEVLSLASFKGSRVFGPGSQRIVLIICAAAMGVFGVMFIHGAIQGWAGW